MPEIWEDWMEGLHSQNEEAGLREVRQQMAYAIEKAMKSMIGEPINEETAVKVTEVATRALQSRVGPGFRVELAPDQSPDMVNLVIVPEPANADPPAYVCSNLREPGFSFAGAVAAIAIANGGKLPPMPPIPIDQVQPSAHLWYDRDPWWESYD